MFVPGATTQQRQAMSVQISAAQAVAEHLQSPDDLQRIAAFRTKLEKEKASIDAKLKNGVKDQLDATRDGLKKLFSTRVNVQAIKDEMITLDKAGRDSVNQIKTFDQISSVSLLVHRVRFILTMNARSLQSIATLHRQKK